MSINKKNIEFKKEKLQDLLEIYNEEFRLKGYFEKAEQYKSLSTAISFTYCKKSIKMVEDLYKIMKQIENYNNNNKINYEKLNEKLFYKLEEMIENISLIVLFDNSNNKNNIIKSFAFNGDEEKAKEYINNYENYEVA